MRFQSKVGIVIGGAHGMGEAALAAVSALSFGGDRRRLWEEFKSCRSKSLQTIPHTAKVSPA